MISLVLMILLVFSVKGTELYSWTWDSGGNEGFTATYNAQQQPIEYASNMVGSSSDSIALGYRAINLTTDYFNISWDMYSQSNRRQQLLGFSESNSSVNDADWYTGLTVAVYVDLDEANPVVLVNESLNHGTSLMDTCEGSIDNTDVSSWLWEYHSNGTNNIYQDGVLRCNYVYLIPNINAIVLSPAKVTNNYRNFYDNMTIMQSSGTPEASLTLYHNLVDDTDVPSTTLFEYITYNGTYANTDSEFNCSLLVNRSNEIKVNISELVDMDNTQDFNYSYSYYNGNIGFQINCYNDDLNESTGFYNYNVDTTGYINYALNMQILENVQNIWEEINMIPVILIWALLTIGSFILMSGKNYLVGLILYGYSTVFDLFLTGWLFNTYSNLANTTTYYGWTVAVMIVGIASYVVIKIVIPVFWKRYYVLR